MPRLAAYTHDELLYTKYMGDEVVDAWMPENIYFEALCEGKTVEVPCLDFLPTVGNDGKDLRIAVVNRHPDQMIPIDIKTGWIDENAKIRLYGISGATKDSFNDIDCPNQVAIFEEDIKRGKGQDLSLEIRPHSVNVLVISVNREGVYRK